MQLPSGAVQGGKLTSADRQEPVAFNSGMVLDGFVSLLECRPDAAIAEANAPENAVQGIRTRTEGQKSVVEITLLPEAFTSLADFQAMRSRLEQAVRGSSNDFQLVVAVAPESALSCMDAP